MTAETFEDWRALLGRRVSFMASPFYGGEPIRAEGRVRSVAAVQEHPDQLLIELASSAPTDTVVRVPVNSPIAVDLQAGAPWRS